jgi:IS30 family transposase
MKPHYKHLTQEQRYTISAELKSGKKLSCIANDLGVHRTTLWRELKHNTGQRGYRPAQAHKMASARRPKGKCSVRDFGKAFIACKLKQHWSPEQISRALLTMVSSPYVRKPVLAANQYVFLNNSLNIQAY